MYSNEIKALSEKSSQMKNMVDIRLDSVCKTYANGVAALQDVTVAVGDRTCLAMLGPSGCGKTTLLRVIAGLERPESGTVRLGGRVVNHVPAHQRDVALVFQRPALVPGKTVRDNLAWPWSKIHDKELDEVASILGVDALLDRRAGELSGGQQQRVALGRALLRRAPVCLLDEPLGHLETALRAQLRRDLRLLSRRFPATIIHVTHDPAEALAVGNQVAVLHNGRVQQVGAPEEVLRRPANRFVAEFCHPQGPMNFVEGRVEGSGDGNGMAFVAAPWLRVKVPAALSSRPGANAGLTLGLDAGEIKILPAQREESASPYTMMMDVILTEFAPQGNWVTCGRDGVRLTGLCDTGPAPAIGTSIMLAISTDKAFWFETATGITLAAPVF
jgi:ABC-type sugar transport system ATPase subunit